MTRVWKSIKVWWMYWRYREITQRRQRMQIWMNKRRPGARPLRPQMPRGFGDRPYTGRANYQRRGTRAWIPLVLTVALLAVLQTYGYETHLANAVLRGIGGLIIIIGIYTAVRIVQ